MNGYSQPRTSDEMHTFQELAEFVQRGRDDYSRRVSANTVIIQRSDTAVAVRYHDTDVVTHYADGSIRLDNGGWFTVTTKRRMCDYTPHLIDGPTEVQTRRTARDGGPWEVRTRCNVTPYDPVVGWKWLDSARFVSGMVIPADGSLQEHKARFFQEEHMIGAEREADRILRSTRFRMRGCIADDCSNPVPWNQGSDYCGPCLSGDQII